jgi:hypothetical protein
VSGCGRTCCGKPGCGPRTKRARRARTGSFGFLDPRGQQARSSIAHSANLTEDVGPDERIVSRDHLDCWRIASCIGGMEVKRGRPEALLKFLKLGLESLHGVVTLLHRWPVSSIYLSASAGWRHRVRLRGVAQRTQRLKIRNRARATLRSRNDVVDRESLRCPAGQATPAVAGEYALSLLRALAYLAGFRFPSGTNYSLAPCPKVAAQGRPPVLVVCSERRDQAERAARRSWAHVRHNRLAGCAAHSHWALLNHAPETPKARSRETWPGLQCDNAVMTDRNLRG